LKVRAIKAAASVFAVLLKQTRRVNVALAAIKDKETAPPQSLLRLWKKAVPYAAKVQTVKTMGEDIEKYLVEFNEKIEFLLSLAPSSSFSNAISQAEVAEIEKIRAEHKKPSSASTPAPPLKRTKSLLWRKAIMMTKLLSNTMKALRRLREFISLRTTSRFAQKRTLEETLCDKVGEFIDMKKTHLPNVYGALVAQRSRAVLRLYGMQYFAKLALSLDTGSLVPELLRHLSMALRKPVVEEVKDTTPSSSSTDNKDAKKAEVLTQKFHFLNQIETAGSGLRDGLSDAYFGLIGALIQKEEKEGSNIATNDSARLFLLDCINLDATADDLKALNKIGIVPFVAQSIYEHMVVFAGVNPALRKLLDQMNSGPKGRAGLRRRPWNNRFGAWGLLRLITYLSASHAHGGAEEAQELQNSVLEVLRQQLEVLLSMRAVEPVKGERKEEKDSKSTDVKTSSSSSSSSSSSAPSSSSSLVSREDKLWEEEKESLSWLTSLGPVYYYESDFDTLGILYALGTDYGITDWRSPVDRQVVALTSSSVSSDAKDLGSLVGRKPAMFSTAGSSKVGEDWVKLDFKEHKVLVTAYTVRHWQSAGNALRSWHLEGSNDNSEWEVIDSRTNDDSLAANSGATATFFISKPTKRGYMYLRLIQTGPNSSGNNKLALSGLEFYGVYDPSAVAEGPMLPADWLDKATIYVSPFRFVPLCFSHSHLCVCSLVIVL
jgi:hypothetical protein